MIPFTEHRLPVDEGAHDLFEEEGIPLGFLEDDLPDAAGRFSISRRLSINWVDSVGERGLRRISV